MATVSASFSDSDIHYLILIMANISITVLFYSYQEVLFGVNLKLSYLQYAFQLTDITNISIIYVIIDA